MFTWLYNLLFGRRGEGIDFYTPRERLIYTYFTGTDAKGKRQYARADPLELWKRVMDNGPAITINMKVAASKSKDARAKHDELMEDLRKAFQVRPYREGGLTDVELMDLFNHFMAYVGGVKKNSPTSTTSAPPEAEGPSPASSPSTGGGPPTESSSGSGSTGSGPASSPPAPPPSASPSPSA